MAQEGGDTGYKRTSNKKHTQKDFKKDFSKKSQKKST